MEEGFGGPLGRKRKNKDNGFQVETVEALGSWWGKVGARDVQDTRNKEDSEGCSCLEKQTEHTSIKTFFSEIHRGEMGRGIVRN